MSTQGFITLEEAAERFMDPYRIESNAEIVALLSEEDRAIILEGVDMEDYLYDWSQWGRPKQIIPSEPYYNVHLLLMGRGYGKLLSIDTPILMADGSWKKNGDLVDGDIILDEEGNPTTVLQAHDITVPDKAYRLHFSDGTWIDAGGEHLWTTWTHAERKSFNRTGEGVLDINDTSVGFPVNWPRWDRKNRWGGPKGSGPKVRTTQDIVDTFTYGKRRDTNHSIPLVKPIPFEEKEYLVPPEILGYWLGDGHTADQVITCHVDEVSYVTALMEKYGFKTTSRMSHDNTWSVRVLGLRKLLKEIGVLGNKHIPEEYLTGSVDQRTALLSGLLDSDGTINKTSGHIEFCTVLPALAKGVTHLVRTLGEKPTGKWSGSYLYGVQKKDRYRLSWRPKFNPFGLERKRGLYQELGAQSLRNYHRMIVAYEEITPGPMRCITVDSPNALYLAGEGLIPTHNTRAMSEFARSKAMAVPGTRIALMGRTNGETRDILVSGESGVMSIPQPENERPVYKSAEGRVVWPNGSEAKILSAEQPDSARGGQYHYAIVDELAAHTPFVGSDGVTAFQNVRIATRLGERPTLVVATTPKKVQVLRDMIEESKDPTKSIRVVHGKTSENTSNLSSVYMDMIYGTYAGTSLARQELEGEMLDEEIEGALWSEEDIIVNLEMTEERARRLPIRLVAVDPSVAENPNDECGIVVIGATNERAMYKRKAVVLEDASLKASPEVWAQEVVRQVKKWKAVGAVVEKNQGHHLLTMAIHAVDPNIRVFPVNAGLSKAARAEPVSQVYEQKRVTHLYPFPLLEQQMVTWEPSISKKSPDRVDALVWGITAAIIKPPEGMERKRLRSSLPGGRLPEGFGMGFARRPE